MSDLPQPIVVDPPAQEAHESTVTVSDVDGKPVSGVTVRAVQRPGLDGTRELAVGITDGLGRVRWTPAEPGVAVLHAGSEALPVGVAWDQPPGAAVVLIGSLALFSVVAVLAGLGDPRRWYS